MTTSDRHVYKTSNRQALWVSLAGFVLALNVLVGVDDLRLLRLALPATVIAMGLVAACWRPKVLVDTDGFTVFGLFGEQFVSWETCSPFSARSVPLVGGFVRYQRQGSPLMALAPRLEGFTASETAEYLEDWRTSAAAL